MIWFLDYLGEDSYAVFAVLLSLEGWLMLTDFGLGSSAQNQVSVATAKQQLEKAALVPIAQLSILTFLSSLLFISLLFPWIHAFLNKNTTCGKAGLLLAVLGYCLLALGSIAYRILYAKNRGVLVHIIQGAAFCLTIITAFLLKHFYFGEYRLFLALITVIVIPCVFSLATFFKIFGVKFLKEYWDWEAIQALVTPALKFFIFGLSAIAVLGIDYIALARYTDSKTIVLYHIMSKLFSGFFVMHGSFMQAIWPVCSENIAKGNTEKVAKILKKCCLYGILFISSVTCFLLLGSSTLCSLFFSKPLSLPIEGILLLGLYYIIRTLCDPYAMVLQSMNRLTPLLIGVPCQALVAIIFQIYLVQFYGLYGVIIGLICSYLCTVSWLLPFCVYRRTLFHRK
jgi:O-antigen/teichoic acid export membrane protein